MYTIINALIVAEDASYVSTQIHGNSAAAAHRDALRWVQSRFNPDANITQKSPVFLKDTHDGAVMEQLTVGACIRLLTAHNTLAKEA